MGIFGTEISCYFGSLHSYLMPTLPHPRMKQVFIFFLFNTEPLTQNFSTILYIHIDVEYIFTKLLVTFLPVTHTPGKVLQMNILCLTEYIHHMQ
jgi:hypothetical protein